METLMDRAVVEDIALHLCAINAHIPIHAINNSADYDKAVTVMRALLEAGATDENHPLASALDVLGSLIGEYDDIHFPAKKVSPEAMLRFFMDQHRLSQSDLPEVGSQGVVSEILNGRRELNLRQIRVLAARFKVSPAVFIE